MKACDVVLQDGLTGKMSAIGDSLRENYFMIGLSILVLCIAAFFIWLLVNNIMGTVKSYHRFAKRPSSSLTMTSLRDKPDDVVSMQIANILSDGDANASGDNYGVMQPASDAALREPAPEGASIQQKINEIKGIYASYNKEITDYSRKVQKREPTDLMDERIMSKDDDTYDV